MAPGCSGLHTSVKGPAGGQAMHDPADLTSFAGIEKMRRRIEAESGPIDILVANACGSPVKPGPLRRPARKAGASVDGNLAATYLTLKSVLPGMKERDTGCVITMSSAAARRPHLGSPIAYAAAKGGDPTPHQRRRRAGRPLRYPGSTASPQMIFTEANQGLLPPAKQRSCGRVHLLPLLGTRGRRTGSCLSRLGRIGLDHRIVIDVAPARS
jgi:3-oxoacyl-[acyl-carrier protein] reductase